MRVRNFLSRVFLKVREKISLPLRVIHRRCPSVGGRGVKRHLILLHCESTILFTIVTLTIITAACDQPFDPVQENERHFFSVNGYLDASADTQWIRVMPVRESLDQDSGLSIPIVTLQHLESGEQVVMRDSVFHFPGDRYAYNFWTTLPVLPEQSYRLVVEGPDGRASHAEATLPEDFPQPRFREPEFGADILLIEEVERLADIQVVYRIRDNRTGEEFEAPFPYLQYSVFIPQSTYRVSINPEFGRTQIMAMYCGITVVERNVFVASGGPGWPDFVSLDRHTITLPDGISNVENGVGFFGGVVSKTFPYISAEGEHGLFQVSCPS